MSIVECKKCGRELPSYSVFCQHCGYKVTSNTANQPQIISSIKIKQYTEKLAFINNYLSDLKRKFRESFYISASFAILFILLIYISMPISKASKPLHITDEFVCKAAIGAIFGRSPQNINTAIFNNIVHLQYIRPSDSSSWKSKCKVSGNTVHWASTNEGDIGRWRNHEMDSRVTFFVDQKSYDITITQTHFDKSETVKKYAILDIEPTFDLELIPLITTKPTSSQKFLSEKKLCLAVIQSGYISTGCEINSLESTIIMNVVENWDQKTVENFCKGISLLINKSIWLEQQWQLQVYSASSNRNTPQVSTNCNLSKF